MYSENFTDKFGARSITFRRLREVLPVEDDRPLLGYVDFPCVLNSAHSSARIPRDSMQYQCADCLQSVSQESVNEQFQAWLLSGNYPEPPGLAHINPLDAQASGENLLWWPDCEGNALLYKGSIHFIYGKPETLKSWFALKLLIDADVRVWDFENGISGTKERLLALGVPRAKAHGYASPQTREEIIARVNHYGEFAPEILIVDGFSGFAQVMGINPDSNGDVMDAYGLVFSPLKKAGVCVVVIDHLPKDSVTFDYPIGAQAKKSQADVAIFFKGTSEVNTVEAYVTKDRHGLLNKRSEAGGSLRRLGNLSLVSQSDSVELTFVPAYLHSLNGVHLSASEADLMGRIYNFVKENPLCSKSSVELALDGKNQRIRDSIGQLLENGILTLTRAGGNSHLLQVGDPLNISRTVY